MTASELIAKLQDLQNQFGDLVVTDEDGLQIEQIWYWSDEDEPPHNHGFAISGVEPSPFKS